MEDGTAGHNEIAASRRDLEGIFLANRRGEVRPTLSPGRYILVHHSMNKGIAA